MTTQLRAHLAQSRMNRRPAQNGLRLALPPLAELTQDSIVPFVLLDRDSQLLRSGELPLRELAQAVPASRVLAILHPGEAIVASITLPPLPRKQLEGAVQASVEPMALSQLEHLCIAHGPRSADGIVQVAWADRRALLTAWQTLSDVGLKVAALFPLPMALPAQDPHPDRPLVLPADARWMAPLPPWSLARPEWRPTSTLHRWRAAGVWAGAAALLWLVGLNIYAAQLRDEARSLRAATEQAVRQAFPALGIIVDPVQQARQQRDALRLASGAAGDDGFMPLALGAAKVLSFADGHVASLHYEDNTLTLVLSEGYIPPANEAALNQAAAVQALTLEKDGETAHTWRVRRPETATARTGETRR